MAAASYASAASALRGPSIFPGSRAWPTWHRSFTIVSSSGSKSILTEETPLKHVMPEQRRQRSLRFRYAESLGSGLNVGFTDGTDFNFPTSWLQKVMSGGNGKAKAYWFHTCFSESSLRLKVSDESQTPKFGLCWEAETLRSLAEKEATVLQANNLQKAFKGPAVWTGDDLKNCSMWGLELSLGEIADLKCATRACLQTVTWRAEGVPEVFPKEQFPLGDAMTQKLAAIADEIEFGKGLAMVRNMPVDDPDLSHKDLAVMYMGISAHLGHVMLQSSSGLRSVSRGYGMPLGLIQAEMTGETPKLGKQTNNHFRLHTDRCDVISLLCIRRAPSGGASRVCSAPAVYNAILSRSPELAKALTEPIDRIWEGEGGYFRLPIVGVTPSGQFTTQISPSYVENAQFLDGAAKATKQQIEALDAIEEIGMELGAEFTMKPGMMYFLNNHQVYHGRGNWAVTPKEESGAWGQEGRLLFRTWISPFNSRPLPNSADYRKVWGSVEAGSPRGGWDQAIQTGEVPKPKIPEHYVYYSLYNAKIQSLSMHGSCGTVLEY